MHGLAGPSSRAIKEMKVVEAKRWRDKVKSVHEQSEREHKLHRRAQEAEGKLADKEERIKELEAALAEELTVDKAVRFLVETGEQFAINLTHTTIYKKEGTYIRLQKCSDVKLLLSTLEMEQAKNEIAALNEGAQK